LTEGPLRTGSFLSYQILIFLILFIWAFIGFEVAQFQLVRLYESPFTWIAWATFVLVSLIPAVTAVTWRMKTLILFTEPEWNFREREISLSEYERMMKQYRSEYRNFLSIIDYGHVLLAFIISICAVIIPFLLMRTTIILIAATPVLFGLCVLLFGLFCSSIIFKLIPNEATPHFPSFSDKYLRPMIVMMQATPGISWTGVSVVLGEASGFYTIRNVTPVSRIEGIEGVAKIQGIFDESGQVTKVVSILSLDDSEKMNVIDQSSADYSTRKLTEMVYKTLQAYIEAKGTDEIMDEVLEEVTFFMKQFGNE
jgi:hypothetical protein